MDRRSRLEVAYSSPVSAGFSTGFSYALVARIPVDRPAQLASALQGRKCTTLKPRAGHPKHVVLEFMSSKLQLPDDVLPVVPPGTIHSLSTVTIRAWMSAGHAPTSSWAPGCHRPFFTIAHTTPDLVISRML